MKNGKRTWVLILGILIGCLLLLNILTAFGDQQGKPSSLVTATSQNSRVELSPGFEFDKKKLQPVLRRLQHLLPVLGPTQ